MSIKPKNKNADQLFINRRCTNNNKTTWLREKRSRKAYSGKAESGTTESEDTESEDTESVKTNYNDNAEFELPKVNYYIWRIIGG